MRVYIVVHSDYERDVILGVYASLALAEAAKRRNGRHERFDQDPDDDADWDVELGEKCLAAREWDDAHIEPHRVHGHPRDRKPKRPPVEPPKGGG